MLHLSNKHLRVGHGGIALEIDGQTHGHFHPNLRCHCQVLNLVGLLNHHRSLVSVDGNKLTVVAVGSLN